MANQTFEAIRLSDEQTFAAFAQIAKAMATDGATVHVTLAERHHGFEVPLSKITEHAAVKELLLGESASASHLSLSLPNINGGSVQVVRQPKSVQVAVQFSDQLDHTTAAKLINQSHRHLSGYDQAESVRRVLGDEIAEGYARREVALLRLEGLAQKLIEQNENYRRKLDDDHAQTRQKLDDLYEQKRAALEDDYQQKHSAHAAKEEALAAKAKKFDDRDSRHVRREIRQDLKNALAGRAKEFRLTRSTTSKRVLIHTLFALLLVASAAIAIHGLWYGPAEGEGPQFWFHALRIGIAILGFAASILFYIRWTDHWFRQHADEEFRLKRLELDIDRASWVVEMALEWKGEKGSDIPEELVERLTRSLFTDRDGHEHPRHPSEDLGNALFEAMKSLRVNIPGLGVAEFDRRNLKRFRANAASARHREQ